jgi:hypothetical protein
MKLPVSVECLYNQKSVIRENAGELVQLLDTIGRTNDLNYSQALHWYSLTLEYNPDIIIELGRAYGNSTCVFNQAARRLRKTRVKSFCRSIDWQKKTKPEIARIVEKDWFSSLEIYSCDITGVDFASHIVEGQRILLLWDAHGYDIADHVLSHIVPFLQSKEHLVVCHDVTDNRVFEIPRSYDGKSFWRGMRDFESNPESRARANLFWINTIVDQFIPILDFCWRNNIELHSADYELYEIKKSYPEIIESIRRAFPGDYFSEANHWAYFTLNEAEPPYNFPTAVR